MTYEAILRFVAGGTGEAAPPPVAEPPAWKPDPPSDLGAKPEGEAFGYLDENRLHVTTREALARRLAKHPGTPAVWTPDTEGLARPEDVPSLVLEVRAVENRLLRRRVLAYGFLVPAMLVAAYVAWRAFGVYRTVFLVFAVLGALALAECVIALRRPEPRDADAFARAREASRHEAWVRSREALFARWITGCLIAVAVIAIWPEERAVAAAGLVKDRVWAEPFRLLTAPMLHVEIYHIGMNASAMLWLGSVMEAHDPRTRLPLVFLVSAFAGALASWTFLPATSVGASGGILGVLGYLLVLARRRHWELPSDFRRTIAYAVVFVAGLGVLGFAFIDNAAHAGGLLAGVLLGRALVSERDDRPEPAGLQAAGELAVVVITVAAALTLFLVIADPQGAAATASTH